MNNYVYAADKNRYECGMKYRRAGKSGILLPEISLGMWHNFGDIDIFSTCKNIVHYAFDHGITHFDLANNYGPSAGSAEETFGQIMQNQWHLTAMNCLSQQKPDTTCGKVLTEPGTHANIL